MQTPWKIRSLSPNGRAKVTCIVEDEHRTVTLFSCFRMFSGISKKASLPLVAMQTSVATSVFFFFLLKLFHNLLNAHPSLLQCYLHPFFEGNCKVESKLEKSGTQVNDNSPENVPQLIHSGHLELKGSLTMSLLWQIGSNISNGQLTKGLLTDH